MKKVKFQIEGMHCNSCAILIEEKLKNLPGVIQAKINHVSGIGAIVYDENRIERTEIQREIENAGEYSVKKIEDAEKEKSIRLSVPISIIIAGLIIGGAVIIDGGTGSSIAKPVPSQAQPNTVQPEPSEQDSVVQFDITSESHIRGNPDAPITLVEFSDFECPFCVRHYPTLKKILNDYWGKVRLVYKHFPLSFHPNGQKTAEASECAGEQNFFWEYHDKLFDNFQIGYSLENFKKWAKELGLNAQQFNICLDSGKYAQKVQTDYQEGLQKGVNGTPATFVNGQLVSGALPYESFKQIIDNLLSAL
jgi:protein-disulfide isomerase/copper chaperone CopZ